MSVETLVHKFAKNHPMDAARILERIDVADVSDYLGSEDAITCAGLLSAVDATVAAMCLNALEISHTAAIISHVSLESGASFLRRMTPEMCSDVLGLLDGERRPVLEGVLRYPENTAGSLMDPLALALPKDISLGEGLSRVRRHPERASYYLYVIERDGPLLGVLSIRDLMIGEPDTTLFEAMQPNPARLNAGDSLTAVSAHPGWLEYQVLPVCDDAGVFLGALRHKTLRRLLSDPALRGSARSTGSALGELFQIGLTGMAQLAGTLPPEHREEGHRGE